MRKRSITILAILAILLAAILPASCQQNATTATTRQSTAKTPSDPVELTIMAKLNNQPGSDHPMIRLLEEKTNTKLTFEVPPYKNYEERMTLMFASGSNMADMAFFNYYGYETLYRDTIKEGSILPITEWVMQAANLQAYIDPDSWFGAKGPDGEIYGVPGNTYTRVDGWLIRLDWLENVGLSLPADNELTLDALNEILKRFSEDDPNRSGKNDTYGITKRSAQGVLDPLFAHAFDVIGWDENTGRYPYMHLMYSLEHDNYKDALAHTAWLWDSGYIDPNWPANESVSDLERFAKGIAGMVGSFAGHMDTTESQTLANFPEARVGYVSLVKASDSDTETGVRSPYGSNTYFNWVITSAAADKEEAIVDFLDYTVSDEGYTLLLFGVEGTHYTIENESMTVTELYDSEIRPFRGLSMPRRYNDVRLYVLPNLSEEKEARVNSLLERAQSLVLPSLDKGYIPEVAGRQPFIDAKTELDIVRTRIILGELPVESWDTALQNWYDAGGREYVADINRFIKDNQ
ncbi:MAG: extracellular solute-binding protein [Bacillota bacterium]|nr:extracellular solute-binding protein [Bacillota bacterium]